MKKYTEASKKALKVLKYLLKLLFGFWHKCLNFTAAELLSKVNEIKTEMAKTWATLSQSLMWSKHNFKV